MRIVTTLVLSCLLLVGSAAADTILSNLPGTPGVSGTNLGLGIDAADRTKGVGLTMGASAMDFQSMVALIANTTPPSVLSGGIYSSVSNNPGALLAAFTPVAVAANAPAAEVSITTAAPFTLQAGTSYWFVLDGPTTTNSLLWHQLSVNTAPTAAPGYTFVGYRFSSNGGTTWGSSTIYNGMSINVVPEPMSLGMLALVGALALRRR